MNTPIPSLMRHYGTEDVFLMKTSDASPLLARLGMGILNYSLATSEHNADEKQRNDDAVQREAVREYELAKMQQANNNLRHTHAPMLLPAGSQVPPGWDEGMVRIASIVAQTGVELAKKAGMSLLGGMGVKSNLLLAGGMVGAGVLATKGLRAGTRALSREPAGPPVYGKPAGGVGYQVPSAVNAYGVPQHGTPFM